LSRRAFGSGKKKKRRSAGGVSTSSDDERASNIRQSLDEAVSRQPSAVTPELDPASAVDDMRRRSSEVHRFDTRRGSLATPSELFENQEKADIRLSKARDEISYVLSLPGFAVPLGLDARFLPSRTAEAGCSCAKQRCIRQGLWHTTHAASAPVAYNSAVCKLARTPLA